MESTGQAKAEAQSRAEASKIEGEASVQQAKLKSEATSIEAVSLPNTLPLLVDHQGRTFLSCCAVCIYCCVGI